MLMQRTTLFWSTVLHGSLITAAIVGSHAGPGRTRVLPPLVQVVQESAPSVVPPLPCALPDVVAEPEVLEPVVVADDAAAAPEPSVESLWPATTAVPRAEMSELQSPSLTAELVRQRWRASSTTQAASTPEAAPASAVAEEEAAPDAPTQAATTTSVLVPIDGTNLPPDYPALAKRRGQSGTVVVRFTCDEQGLVVAAEVVRSCGFVLLDEAALRAVRRWRFANGPGQGEQPFTFSLRS